MLKLSLLDASALLFGLAAVLGVINHHIFKLPFTIGMTFSALLASVLVLALDAVFPGVGLAHTASSMLGNIDFTYALLNGMLGFLLFAGALHTDLDALKSRAMPVLALAVFGTMISTAIIGVGSFWLFGALGLGMPFLFCLVFGALISPTDPVAVLGIMKAAKAPHEIEIKVIGESLFNDGIGVIVFAVLVSMATGGAGLHGGTEPEAFGAEGVLQLLAKEVFGGVGLGLVFGYMAYRALRSLDESNLEILISVALVMVLNLIAFKLHVSSPLACVVAGLFIGNRGRSLAMSARTRQHLDIVWSFIDEALNAVLFLLVGLEVMIVAWSGPLLVAGLVCIVLVLGARFVAVALPINVLKALRVSFNVGTTRILTWGGLKGGISIALAMSLPEFAGRDVVVTSTYLVVVFSILVQGMTVGKLIKKIATRAELNAPAPDDSHALL